MKTPVGYRVNYPEGINGEKGPYFDYIMASNGVFIEAKSRLVAARIPISRCAIRGLAPLKPYLTLTYGSIPQNLWDTALSTILSSPMEERYLAVSVSNGYRLEYPNQRSIEDGVIYENGENIVLDIHSHGPLKAGFSSQDNSDELGFRLSAVVGCLTDNPKVILRVGVYGYYYPLYWTNVFDGTLSGAEQN